MKFVPFLFLVILISCQPQIESRAHMDKASNRMSDSIIDLIDSSLADPLLQLAGKNSPNTYIENKN